MVCCCFLVLIPIAIKNGGRHYCMNHTRMGKGSPCTMFWPKSCGEVQRRTSFMRYRKVVDSWSPAFLVFFYPSEQNHKENPRAQCRKALVIINFCWEKVMLKNCRIFTYRLNFS